MNVVVRRRRRERRRRRVRGEGGRRCVAFGIVGNFVFVDVFLVYISDW